MKDKIQRFVFDSDKLNEENAKLLDEIDNLKKKINDLNVEKDQLQKKFTKQVKMMIMLRLCCCKCSL